MHHNSLVPFRFPCGRKKKKLTKIKKAGVITEKRVELMFGLYFVFKVLYHFIMHIIN